VRQVVADGEGAGKVIEVTVRGARSETDAEAAAKAVANSPLVKCAIGGADPNLGRIVAALGKSPARIAPDRLTVRVGGLRVFARGSVLRFDRARVRRHLQRREVAVLCDLGLGKGAFTALTCDLTAAYVRINTQYHT
jgi:glutamate N-acetyltransferase/amino-acid N-acetyltransferase